MNNVLAVLWVVIGILLLIFMNTKLKLHNLFAILIAGIVVALLEGMQISEVLSNVHKGIGDTLGGLALVIIFGAIIGELMTASGASQRIASSIIKVCGTKLLPFGLMFMGVIFGMAMFYEVAFLISVPLVIGISKEAKIPYMKLIIPTVAGATMGHSLLPPQPGPMAIVTQLGIDVGSMYIYGIIVVAISVLCAGLVLPKIIAVDKIKLNNELLNYNQKKESELPSFGRAIIVPIIPAILMITATICRSVLGADSSIITYTNFLGSSEISMLIAVFAAIYLYGVRQKMSKDEISEAVNTAIKAIANVLLVIAVGGVLKQVIIVTGVGDDMVDMMSSIHIAPILMAWLITAAIRIMTGQGAVAAITSAGIMSTAIASMNVNPVLIGLAIACGSNTITLMYDGGFILFKETFGISTKETFKTWGLLELINSLVGLAVLMVLSLFM